MTPHSDAAWLFFMLGLGGGLGGCVELVPSDMIECVVGELGCVCTIGGGCDPGLACRDEVCEPIAGATSDCPMDDNGGCIMVTCGDGMAQGVELCDGNDNRGATCQSLGFDSGEVICEADCVAFDTSGCGVCGNGVVDGQEVCDDLMLQGQTCMSQGFDSGNLGCGRDCLALDTSACGICGNGQFEGGELCDGMVLAGETCMSQGFDSGTLGCTVDCGGYDTNACGTCGTGEIDGGELCDGADLGAGTCITQGFDSGDLSCQLDCMAYDTASCGTCGNGFLDGTEDCEAVDLDGVTCESLGASGGELACAPDCRFDLLGCDIVAQQYDVSLPSVSTTQSNYFRGHGYDADGDGLLADFEVYLGLAAPCDLDFYVYEAPASGGPYTLLVRTTVNAGPGTDYYPAGIPTVLIHDGMYYITGVAWNCSATYYMDDTGAFAGVDAGIGVFNVSHWDNRYPGASDLYVPPETGGGDTVYAHRVYYTE